MLTRARRTSLVALATLLAACGGSATPTVPGGPGATAGPGGPGATSAPGGAGAPVTVTLDGETYGYTVGTCEVTDEVVIASAGIDGEFAGVDVTWRGDGSAAEFQAVYTNVASGPPAPFQLYADAARPGTTWDVQVSGTTAVIHAHMNNELPATQGNPELAEYDVTIRIDCAQRGFGGMAPPATEGPLPTSNEPVPTAAGEASISLQLGGTTYVFSYLGCPMTETAISFVVVDPSLNRLFVSAGEAQFLTSDGQRYGAQGVEFGGSSQQATWSGTMTPLSGAGEAASITITC